MENELNLVQKLAQIRNMVNVVAKDKRGFNYNYSDITEILAKVTAGMKKYGVSLIPYIVPGTTVVQQNVVTNTKLDKAGNAFDNTTTEMLVKADMVFKWVNNDNLSDVIEIPWVITGSQSDPSQALGSGLTYCTRYFLTSYFQIAQAQSQDVDAYRSKQKSAEAEESKMIAEEIINAFDATVKSYLAQYPDKSDDVKRCISRYAKNANYFAIKDPALASRMVQEFSDKFLADIKE